MGFPHTSVDLPGYPKGDGMHGTPIGLNKDQLNVFTVEDLDGTPVLHISGEIFGGLSTKDEFENYHLKMEFKRGEKRYEPRLDRRTRNGGLLYHTQEPYGQFWNAWMKAPEMQMQESDVGDFHPLAGVSMDIRVSETTEDPLVIIFMGIYSGFIIQPQNTGSLEAETNMNRTGVEESTTMKSFLKGGIPSS